MSGTKKFDPKVQTCSLTYRQCLVRCLEDAICFQFPRHLIQLIKNLDSRSFNWDLKKDDHTLLYHRYHTVHTTQLTYTPPVPNPPFTFQILGYLSSLVFMNLPRFTVEASGGSPSRKEKHFTSNFILKLIFWWIIMDISCMLHTNNTLTVDSFLK